MDYKSKIAGLRSFGLMQHEIAAFIGKTQSWVSQYELGRIPSIKLGTAQKIDSMYSKERAKHLRKMKRLGSHG